MEKSSDEPYVLGYALGTEADETNETGPLQMSYAGGPKHGYLAISCLRGFPISVEEGAEAALPLLHCFVTLGFIFRINLKLASVVMVKKHTVTKMGT